MPAMPSNADLSRRGFLALLRKTLMWASGLLVLGGVLRFLDVESEPPPPTLFDLGPADNYPPGSRTLVPEARALLVNTSAGFAAFSLICPHLGCQVESDAGGFACPCHGSQFDARGELRRGPATQPMRSLRVEKLADGNLLLHTDQTL